MRRTDYPPLHRGHLCGLAVVLASSAAMLVLGLVLTLAACKALS